MPSLRRGYRRRSEKIKPEIVTGNFEMHYEDVIGKNRFVIIAFFATGLLLLAAFIPNAVYDSVAGSDQVSVEAEAGALVHPELIEIIQGDVSASNNTFIEFK